MWPRLLPAALSSCAHFQSDNPLPEGVTARTIDTDRLRMHLIESGPEDGIPVLLIHGNLSTGRFYEHLMPGAPKQYRLIAPDMRGFGDTERKPIIATRGVRDWADDSRALIMALGIERPITFAAGPRAAPRWPTTPPITLAKSPR